MTTAREIITKALQKNGVLVKSETPSGDEIDDGLDALNAMISSWSNESLLIYARTWENFTLTGNDGLYTIGSGQDFNTVRPIAIVEAHVRQSDTDYPLAIITDEVYGSSIQYKDTQGIPQFLNYDNGYPYGKIRLWPVPSDAYTLYLLSEKQLTTLAIDDNISFPPGWERALIYNLAMEVAPEYGQEVPDSVVMIARESKMAIKEAVAKNRALDAQPAFGGRKYNIYTGF